MNYKLWFLLVCVNAVILFFSFIKGSIVYSLLSLMLALFLQKSSSKIDFPKLTILGHVFLDETKNQD